MVGEGRTDAPHSARQRAARRRRIGRLSALLALWLCCASSVPGVVHQRSCAAQQADQASDGSQQAPDEQQEEGLASSLEEELERRRQQIKDAAEQKEPPRKPPFEFDPLRVWPAGVLGYFKPRHWTALTQPLVSNDGDFHGQLGTGLLDLGERTLFRARSLRMAPLAKEQPRRLELLLFPIQERANRVPMEIALYGRSTLVPQRTELTPLTPLLPHQFFFVVLSRRPEPYRNLMRSLRCVVPYLEQRTDPQAESRQYQVVFPDDPEGPAPLSGHPLTWTSTAYVLWDDYAPTQLTSEQQHALIDWLHWGGQLIVSGHSTLLELRGSFLDAYLPADEDGQLQLLELDELASAYPGPTVDRSAGARDGKPKHDDANIYITEAVPLLASRLKLRDDVGEPLFTTEEGHVLVAERRVGRGRVVVSALRLSERPVAVWRGFDDFFNALLLRRPGREPIRNNFEGYVDWLGWADGTLRPRRVSQVRYFTRDTIAAPFENRWGPEADQAAEVASSGSRRRLAAFAGAMSMGTDPHWAVQYRGPRVAEWDDFNAVSSTARDLLHQASGITVPPASFVLRWVIAYLVLLVPINWLVFRLLRRVELAWALVPVISLGFAAGLLRTHLNIGFTRAVNEVDIVEAYADYPRGHLTRYTAVYTSTRARYRFSYSEPTAVVLPFPAATATVRGEQARDVVFRWDDPVRLEQMLVQPNSLGMVHAEQMYDLNGTFAWRPNGEAGAAGGTLSNGTMLSFEQAVVVAPRHGSAVLGRLDAGATVQVAFAGPGEPEESRTMTGTRPGEWVQDPSPSLASLGRAQAGEAPAADAQQADTLSAGPLVEIARQTCPSGEVRLVGWLRAPAPGQQIEPAAVRHRAVTMVLVHLSVAPLPAPGKDKPWQLTPDFEFEDFVDEQVEIP